jgi:hypothetical protein
MNFYAGYRMICFRCEKARRNATACRLAVLLNQGGSSEGLVTLSEGVTLTQQRAGSDPGFLEWVSLLLPRPLSTYQTVAYWWCISSRVEVLHIKKITFPCRTHCSRFTQGEML